MANDEHGFSESDQLVITRAAIDALAETRTPGALVGVRDARRGELVVSVGVGNLANAAPIDPASHVRIASVGKTLVATVVLQLVDEGKLTLDDALESIVPGVPNGDRITIRQVLGMTSGVHDFISEPRIAAAYEADPMFEMTPAETLEFIRASTPDFAPGEKTEYSNSNYMLAGYIIETVTGNKVEDELKQRICDPLGLSGTSLATTPDLPEPFLHGYYAKDLDSPLIDVTRSNPATAWTAGAVVSTLADLWTWGKALADGALLSPQMHAAMLTTTDLRSASPEVSVRYGLGVATVNGLIGHSGGIPGFSSWLLHDPEQETTLVIVTNRSAETGGSAEAVFSGLARRLFPRRFPVAASAEAAADAAPA